MIQGITKVNRLLNTILSKKNGIPIIGFTSAAICFCLYFFGYFTAIDSQIYTSITKLSRWQGERAQVLSVEVTDQHINGYESEYWQGVLEQLDSAGAKYIVFTFPVVFNELSNQLRSKVLVGLPRKVLNDKELHPVIKQNSSDWAIADPWPYGSEVQRTRPKETPIDNNSLYAFEKRNHQISIQTIDSLIARKLNREDIFNDRQTFDINFIESEHRIAQMNLREMIHAASIPEVVKDKVIIFGPELSGFYPGVSTPLTGVTKTISQAHYWGIVADTIYNKRPVNNSSYVLLVLLLIFFSFSGLFLREFVSCRWNFTFMLILSGGQVLLTWQLLENYSFWLPAHILIISQWMSFILYSNFSERRNELIIKDISFEMSTYLKSMHENERSYFKSDFWQRKVEMISSSLGVDQIKLMSYKSNGRLETIVDHKMANDFFKPNVLEKKSSFLVEAIRSRGVFKISNDHINESSGNVYWYNLGYEDSVYGAIVFVMNETLKSNQYFRFEQLLKNSTDTLLSPLYSVKNSSINSNYSLKSHSSLEYRPEILEHQFRFLGQKIQALNEYSNRISNPTAYFSTLGEIKQNNDAMAALMKQAKINITNININTLISKISGLNLASCQEIYQGLLVDNNSMVVPSVLILHPSWRKDHKESVSFDLKVSPTYSREDRSVSISGESKVSGILLELVNTNDKSQSQSVEPEKNTLATKGIESRSYDPVRLDMLLTLIFMEFEKELAEKEITYEINDLLDFEVLLAITELKTLIIEAFKVIIEDAHPASTLSVSCKKDNDKIELNFNSIGFGLVEDPLVVVERESITSGSYFKLNQVMKTAKKSGISSSWENEANKGISLKISFTNLSFTKDKAS